MWDNVTLGDNLPRQNIWKFLLLVTIAFNGTCICLKVPSLLQHLRGISVFRNFENVDFLQKCQILRQNICLMDSLFGYDEDKKNQGPDKDR